MPSKKIYFQEDQSFKADNESVQSVPSNYNVITYKERIRLIQMVCIERQQIIHAASSLGIKLSTAKYILRSFRKQGKILKKNEDKSIENENFKNQLEDIKMKIFEINEKKRLKKQERQKKSRNKVISKHSYSYSKHEEISNQLISIPQIHQEKYQQQSRTQGTMSLYESDSNKGSQQYFFLMFYNPICYNSIISQTITA